MHGPDGRLHGPDIDLLNKVSQMTGVKFKYHSGGSFTGMISEVLKNIMLYTVHTRHI